MVSESSRADLVRRITELAARSTTPLKLAEYNRTSSVYRMYELAWLEGIPSDDLDELGMDIARFLGWDPDGAIQRRSSPNTGGTGVVSIIARPIVSRSRFKDAGEALGDFESLVTDNSVILDQVMAVWGINPTEYFEIYDGIFVVPLSGVAPSPSRDELLGIPVEQGARIHAAPYTVSARPKGALQYRFKFSPVLCPLPAGYRKLHDWPPPSRESDRQQEMREILGCLSLIAQSAVAEVAVWYQSDIEVPLVGGGGSCSNPVIQWPDNLELEPEAIDKTAAQQLVQRYFRLPERDRLRVSVALQRLNRAKGKGPIEDRAIDIGIALEALLFDDKTSEILYKLKLRGSVLASDEPQERREIAELLSRLYDYRSRAVHGSLFVKAPKNQRVYQDINLLAVPLLQRLITRAIMLGRLPRSSREWDAAILGWERLGNSPFSPAGDGRDSAS